MFFCRNRQLNVLVSLTFVLFAIATGKTFADGPVKELILPGESFLIEGRPAFVMTATKDLKLPTKPWVIYSPTLPGLPDQYEKWMHEQFLNAGIAVAGIDVGEGYGSPTAQQQFTALYNEMVSKRGYSAKPVLLGRSRGGLWMTNWAAANPDKVAGLAGIYPVFDFHTYPGIDKASSAYKLPPEELKARQAEFNPIEQVGKLAKAKIPVVIIHGDDDKVVPLKENSEEFANRYQSAGASELVTLIVAKGQGHNFWEGFFRCQELVDFTIKHAQEGAKVAVKR